MICDNFIGILVAIFFRARDAHDLVALCVTELARDSLWGTFASVWPTAELPACEGSRAYAQHLAGLESPRSGFYRLFNERNGESSIFRRDQSSSSSPQIASAFFERKQRRNLCQCLLFSGKLALRFLELLLQP